MGLPRPKDIVRLYGHHATPPSQAAALENFVFRMGKQGRQAWASDSAPPWHGQQDSQQGSQSFTWSYWGGPWKPKAGKDGTAAAPSNKFPTYTQTPLPKNHQAADLEVSDVAADTTGLNNYMKELQKALSACRKADGKLRKLQDLRCKRESQWSQYQRELKASYLAQKRQYQKDMDALSQDLEYAVAASRQAVANVQAFAQGQDRMEVSPLPKERPEPDSREADEAWDVFMKQDLSPSPDQPTSDSVLAQALQEAHELARATQAMQAMQLRTATPPLRRTMITPKRGTSTGAPLSAPRRVSPATALAPEPPAGDSPEMLRKLQCSLQQLSGQQSDTTPLPAPSLPSDPYQVPLTSPLASPSPVPKVTPRKSPGHKARAGIKELTKAATAPKVHAGHVPLSEVLQDKRDKLTAQLPSTAAPSQEPSTDVLPAPSSESHVIKAPVFIDDDDPDHHGPSPGFGLME